MYSGWHSKKLLDSPDRFATIGTGGGIVRTIEKTFGEPGYEWTAKVHIVGDNITDEAVRYAARSPYQRALAEGRVALVSYERRSGRLPIPDPLNSVAIWWEPAHGGTHLMRLAAPHGVFNAVEECIRGAAIRKAVPPAGWLPVGMWRTSGGNHRCYCYIRPDGWTSLKELVDAIVENCRWHPLAEKGCRVQGKTILCRCPGLVIGAHGSWVKNLARAVGHQVKVERG